MYARQDQCAAAHPDVRADVDGLAVFLRPAKRRVERMQRREDLDAGSEQGVVADADFAHVEDGAVEIEEHPGAEMDVRAVVAVEGRLHPHAVATGAEQFLEYAAPSALLRVLASVQRGAQRSRALARSREFRIARVVELAGEHFLALGAHGAALEFALRHAWRAGMSSRGRIATPSGVGETGSSVATPLRNLTRYCLKSGERKSRGYGKHSAWLQFRSNEIRGSPVRWLPSAIPPPVL